MTIPSGSAVNVNCGSVLDCNVSGTAVGALYNTGNSSSPDSTDTVASFDSGSGSSLTGCGVGNDGYNAVYNITAGNSSAGTLGIY